MPGGLRLEGEARPCRVAGKLGRTAGGWLGCVDGKGLVAGVAIVKPGTLDPDADLTWDIVWESIKRGVLMFSPVGFGGGTVKICPPLTITEEALVESLDTFEEAFEAAVAGRKGME